MPGTIEDTLRELDTWYRELPGGSDRPKLLAKLATLELCGWVETRMDEMVANAGNKLGLDATWVQKNILARNFGLSYVDHLRPMLTNLIGESGLIRFEASLELSSPGFAEQLKAELGSLWKTRGHLAHTSLATSIPQQVTLNAPSWSSNRQRITAKALDKFESELLASLT